MEYMRNQCPARGPGLEHTMHGPPGSRCVDCGTPLTPQPPSPHLPLSASEARRTLSTSRNADVAMREAGIVDRAPEHTDDTPVEPRAITGEGPQGRPWGVGRGPFTKRDEQRVLQHVEYRKWLATHGGGEEQ